MRIYANNNDIIANIRLSDILEATRSENMVFTCEAKRIRMWSEAKRSEYLFAKTILAKRMRIFIREIYPSEANMRKKNSHPYGCEDIFVLRFASNI